MKRRRQVPGRPALSGEAGDDKRMRVVQFMASEGYGGLNRC